MWHLLLFNHGLANFRKLVPAATDKKIKVGDHLVTCAWPCDDGFVRSSMVAAFVRLFTGFVDSSPGINACQSPRITFWSVIILPSKSIIANKHDNWYSLLDLWIDDRMQSIWAFRPRALQFAPSGTEQDGANTGWPNVLVRGPRFIDALRRALPLCLNLPRKQNSLWQSAGWSVLTGHRDC